MKRMSMEQNDIELLQTVPPYHLQALVKLRRMPLSSSATHPEIAKNLFAPAAIMTALKSLGDVEMMILYELVSCGGRANSRDLALYFFTAHAFSSGKESEAPAASVREHYAPTYPTPHPHGVFEQSLRHLLVAGLLFWGKQTNFAGRDYTSGVYDGVLIVPQAVKDVVHNFVGEEQREQQELEAEQQGEISEGVRAFQRALYLYWSHVAAQREGLQILNSGLLSRTALRQMVELLGPKGRIEQIRTEQDTPRLLFMRLMLMQLGLLQERKGAIHAVSADEFFALSVVERAHRCY